ncbi:MAG TPA: hypothetical protein VF063_00640 [Gaiellaceae bacterium]
MGRAAALVFAALALVASAAAGGFRGDPAAARLLQRVNDSYKRVHAVWVTATDGQGKLYLVLYLRDGKLVAEQSFVSLAPGSGRLVGTIRGGTWARKAGTKCWIHVPDSEAMAFTGLGNPFFKDPGVLSRPRVHGGTYVVTARSARGVQTIAVDRRTYHVRSITSSVTTARFVTLVKAPALPRTQPHC